MPARIAVAGVLVILLATATLAQRGRGAWGYTNRPLRYAVAGDFDGSFQFCRVVFNQNTNGDGGNWAVDYPRADQNLSIRLSELTKTRVGMDGEGLPKHVLVNLRQPELFRCPFIMMTEVGALFLDEHEAKGLRDYLEKGGFLWVDDFWGEYAWEVFEIQLRKALPSARYGIVDLPLSHPIFTSLLPVRRVPQIPSINFWLGSGGRTSERGRDSQMPRARAIVDDHGRVMVFMTYNTDVGDAFEREGDSREYFLEFSVEGYALGVNVLLYAMTH